MAALDHLIAFLDRQKARLEAAKIELRKLYGEVVDEKPSRGRTALAWCGQALARTRRHVRDVILHGVYLKPPADMIEWDFPSSHSRLGFFC
jgi:hypothetical protein